VCRGNRDEMNPGIDERMTTNLSMIDGWRGDLDTTNVTLPFLLTLSTFTLVLCL